MCRSQVKHTFFLGFLFLVLCSCVFSFIPNVNAVTWDLLEQNWDDLTDWTKAGIGTSEIAPAGQLHQEPNSAKYVTRHSDIGMLPGEYTVEFYLKIDSFGTGDSMVRHDFYDGEHICYLAIKAGHIGFHNGVGWQWTAHATGNDWHTWRLVCDSDDDLMNIYKDEVLITSFTGLRDYAPSDGVIYASFTENPAGEDGCESHTDYLYVAAGLYDFPSCYVTFYHNSGGILRANNVTIANTTEIGYVNNTVIELVAIVEGNLTYGFNNFTYNTASNISNPHYLTVTGNATVWGYFGLVDDGFSFLPLAILLGLGCALCFVLALSKS